MNVNLTPTLEKLVQDKVKVGRYNSASEVVREALRLLEEKDQIRQFQIRDLRKKIDAGLNAAVLRTFIASCKGCGIEPFAWFRYVLSRIPAHSIKRLSELLPHNWKPIGCSAQA